MASKHEFHACICPNCAIAFCITTEFYEVKKQQAEENAKNKWFYCPSGHSLAYTLTKKDAPKSGAIMPDTRQYLEAMTGDKSDEIQS